MKHAAVVLCLMAFGAPAYAQTGAGAPPPPRTVSLAGPRAGVTVLSGGVVRSLNDLTIDVKPVITQFGWQIEHQFYGRDGGVAALNEWVFLAGGLDQGFVIPSVSWLVGLRTRDGVEFGMGPNITPAGAALALSAGVTVRSGIVNVPVNLAVVPTRAGIRVSMLIGFTLRR